MATVPWVSFPLWRRRLGTSGVEASGAMVDVNLLEVRLLCLAPLRLRVLGLLPSFPFF
jgi:hypothetical protein